MAKKKIWIISFLAVILVSFLVYYFLYISKGSLVVVRKALSQAFQKGEVALNAANGTLIEGITLKDIRLQNFERLPEGSVLKIQSLFVNINSLTVEGLVAEVENARLFFSGSDDPIIFSGTLSDGAFDFNFYSGRIDVEDILALFPRLERHKLKGYIENVDMDVRGPLYKPSVTGRFEVKKVTRDSFVAQNVPGELLLEIKKGGQGIEIEGEILLKSGTVSGHKTAVIGLSESRVVFAGDPKNPELKLKGASRVEKTAIKIDVRGSFRQPELKLSSEPSVSHERLLVMLATNRSWQGVENVIVDQKDSGKLAKDFVDYFILGGKGNEFLNTFGLADVSVTVDKDTAGIETNKEISDKMGVGYKVQQNRGEGASRVTKKVGSEYKITDEVSAGVERTTEKSEAAVSSEEKVFIKYEKSF